jgi:CRISPR/Cas system-associated endoribonuclease Cas2
MDEFTEPRFYQDPVTGTARIGTLYVAGSNAYINGSRVSETTDLANNAFVNTGSGSSVRIEFDNDNGACLIHIEDFRVGKSYGDTTSCQHTIGTTHADTQVQNSVYNFNVSQQQTEVTVLKGYAKVSLHADPSRIVFVHGGEEAILTANAIIGPRPVPVDEIKNRVRWRDKYQFFKNEVNWTAIGVAAAIIGAIIGIVVGTSGGSKRTPTPPQPPSQPPG